MTTTLKQLGLTPAKGALIVVLAVGMCWVWSPMLFSQSQPSRRQAIASKQHDAKPTAQPDSSQTVSGPEGEATVAKPHVKLTLSEATRHDPFATPDWAPRTQVAGRTGAPSSPNALRARFDSLASVGVAMLLISEQGQAAQIGDRTVHVGDVIEGFRVVEINVEGVKFVPDEQGDGHGA